MRKREFKKGIKVESEHKKTYNFLRNYCQRNRGLPRRKIFYGSIARDHLEEFDNYYSELDKMEKKLKRGKRIRKSFKRTIRARKPYRRQYKRYARRFG